MTASSSKTTRPSADTDHLLRAARERDEAHQNDWALRKARRRSIAWERRLERKIHECADEHEAAKLSIEAELRAEHWGRDPERGPAWLQADGPH